MKEWSGQQWSKMLLKYVNKNALLMINLACFIIYGLIIGLNGIMGFYVYKYLYNVILVLLLIYVLSFPVIMVEFIYFSIVWYYVFHK